MQDPAAHVHEPPQLQEVFPQPDITEKSVCIGFGEKEVYWSVYMCVLDGIEEGKSDGGASAGFYTYEVRTR